MGHDDELWQEFNELGERIENGGRNPELGNPKSDEDVYVGGAVMWVYRRTDDGGVELLMQKRSQYVDGNAGKWDVSAGGHVNYGERWADAAAREAKEEIGLRVLEGRMKFGFMVEHTQIDTNMINGYFFYDYTGLRDEFHFDDKEVEEVKWIPIGEFDNFVQEYAKRPVREDKYVLGLVKAWVLGERV
ncbi:NUDIX domain-containing protein [Candidatus Saccharibacteria bacterium]|nr:NUDIX domain-containing protein [Candidatus Saccharibacteria bacterium]